MRGAEERRAWWRTRWGLALAGFVAVAVFFLLSEHAAHAFGALPYVLLLTCPLMHAFMHQRAPRRGRLAGGTIREPR
jgi:hypothetical protein